MYDIVSGWKHQYGDISVAKLNGIDFYFRMITRNEYKTLQTLFDDPLVIDEKVAQLCVLDPVVDDWGQDIYAGFANTIARLVLEESLIISKPGETGSYVQNRINEEYRKVQNNFEKQMPAIIARAFPAYKIGEIEGWSVKRQIEVYAQATWVLNEIEVHPYGIEFASDEEQ